MRQSTSQHLRSHLGPHSESRSLVLPRHQTRLRTASRGHVKAPNRSHTLLQAYSHRISLRATTVPQRGPLQQPRPSPLPPRHAPLVAAPSLPGSPPGPPPVPPVTTRCGLRQKTTGARFCHDGYNLSNLAAATRQSLRTHWTSGSVLTELDPALGEWAKGHFRLSTHLWQRCLPCESWGTQHE
jgi:hypothetical protein